MVVIVFFAGLVFAGLQGWTWFANATTAVAKPWMAGYVDVTATPSYAFEEQSGSLNQNVVLSFVVADEADPCQPSWGTFYSLDEASAALDLDRRIARTNQQGGEVVVSFGGQLNDELASSCTDPKSLAEAYRSVIDRYDLSTIDIDIEGDDLSNGEAGERRAAVLADLQESRAQAGTPLAIWVTLPVAPTGLTSEGTDAVAQLLEAGVDIAGVNVMTMDYGTSRDSETSMSETAIAALRGTHSQLRTLYRQQEIELGSKAIWNKMGATPMIGQNDVASEVFTLADAKTLNTFAKEQSLGRMSMWSLNRDATCGSNYPDVKRVSTSCSGIDQGSTKFVELLGESFTGIPRDAAGIETTSEPTPEPADLTDDPATSPYPIWAENKPYQQDNKVVWHRNVYVAKYWTQGDVPDNPVLQASETPWQLVGPVLPGEKPLPTLSIPAGTYPEWSGDTVYTKGKRVLFDGAGYEAKWWTLGDSPAAEGANADASPWLKLSDNQVREVLGLPQVGSGTKRD